MLNAWAGAILRGEPVIADGKEGINEMVLSNAMHLSAFLDAPVEIPFDDELYYSELMKRVAVSKKKDTAATVFADATKVPGSTKS